MRKASASYTGLACCIGVALFVAVAAVTWLALLLAELGRFSPWLCLAGGLLTGLAAGLHFARHETKRVTDAPWRWLVMGIALMSLTLTLPPSEMVLGGWDPGVYLHTASSISEQGGLRFQHPDLAALEGMEKELLARDLFGISEPFGGVRILPDGALSPQFYHAYPSLGAVAWSLGGVWTTLLVNPLLNVGCIILLAALASRFVGWKWACAVALLFALNPGQIWQATFSTAEVLTQFFLLGGFVLWADAHSLPERTYVKPLGAGVAFGLALLTRYDAMLVLVPACMLAVWFLPRTERKREVLLMLAAFGTLWVHVWAHQHFVAPYYQPLGAMVVPGLAACFALAVAWLLLSRLPWVRRGIDRLAPYSRQGRTALATLFAAWAAFAWVVRPHLDSTRLDARLLRKLFTLLHREDWFAFLSGPEANNMLYLADVMGALGLLLALAGIVVMLRCADSIWPCTWLYGSVAAMLLLVTSVFHDHFLMWVIRRYDAVVLPLLVLGIGVALQAFGGRMRRAVPLVLLLATVALALPATITVARTRDWPGLVRWYDQLAARVPDASLLYCDQPGFAAPLRFLYGKQAYELHFARTDDRRRRLNDVMLARVVAGDDVLLLTSKPPVESPGLVHEPIEKHPLRTHILNTSRRLPRNTKPRGGAFVLYRVHAEQTGVAE